MAVREFAGAQPHIHDSAYVDASAVVIGNVSLAADSSLWPMTVLRGDVNSIHIGKGTNIQDGTIIHVTHAGPYNPQGYATSVGDNVTIGHRCIIHGCTINDYCLIGMGVCLMDGVEVESHVIIGAGSLATPGKKITSGLWLGSPAKRIRSLTPEELEFLNYSAEYYVKLKNQHILER